MLDPNDIFPHPTTVSRNTAKQTETAKEVLSTQLQSVFSTGGSANFTTDMWTDDFKQRGFTTVTAHFVEEWKIISRVLATQDFPSDLPKTGIHIKEQLKDIFAEFGITEDLLQRSVFTTDKGSNIKLALADKERIDCINHIINRVIQVAFDKAPDAISNLLTSTKELVRYIKKSGLQDQLAKTVKQACPTRWNSTYTMLQSVLEGYDDLQKLFAIQRPRELSRLTAIQKDLLEELVNFLAMFEGTTKACEGQIEPTLHLVIPLMKKLSAHSEVNI